MESLAESTKLTYEDYCDLPDDGKRYEIIDGELYVNPAPNLKHQRVIVNLVLALGFFVRDHKLGDVYVAPTDVVLSKTDVVQPDVLFITNENADRLTRANVQGAPDLAIEVLSESNRRHDEVIKRKRYEGFGVAEYWIVDPELELVKVFRRGADDKFERPMEISVEEGGALTSALLPGFSMPIADVFAD
ncbi:MAG: Uma2 family endonuclease [Acidobacteria bacterium]|nr:Uma2 family endonuclease [Acidobacteriota bacterium]MBV9477635.1 Uma2 family endonuclease [Acidobacteriota bacterium]